MAATVSTSGSAEPGARQRRGSAEVDQLILDAARTVFATNGYPGTSIREVAERAGVREPMVYRRYGSKADLFGSAVLDPLDEAVGRYLDVWASQVEEAGPTENLTRAWVPTLYAILREERRLLVALLGAQEHHSGDLDDLLIARLKQIVNRMLPQARLEIERRPLPGITLPDNIVVSLGMILGVALMDAENGFDLSSERLVEEMVQMTLFGVTGRGPAGELPTGSRKDDFGPEFDRLLDRVADAERRAVRAELERDVLRRRLQAFEATEPTS